MKNLFKNLMLVAVAAMAFTSCSQDVNELNKLEKKTTFEFVASFDGDTRSGFTGSSEDENGKVVYHSEWFGGETVMLVAGDQVKSATVDAEGKFTATFDGEISQIDIYTPMESFYKPYMDYNFYQVNPEVLAEQTPLANSVDPKAHVAKGYVLVDGEGNQIIPVTLAHEVAYGKMTVNAPAEFAIDYVVVNLVGSFNGDKNFTYAINADNVENNTFWFATEPIDVTEFTVTAYDAEGNAVAKTVDMAAVNKTLSFNYGRVSTFSVSGLDVPKPSYPVFTSASWTNAPYHDKLIQFWGEGGISMSLNFSNCNYDNFIDLGEYTIVPNGTGPWKIYGATGTDWCEYVDADGNTYGMQGGKVNVSAVGGEYVIEFIDLQFIDIWYNPMGTLPYAKFTGSIENMVIPDSRTKLATPEVSYTVNGNQVTISWTPVDGAVGYRVRDYNYEIDETTTETTITAELTKYQYYYIYVSAIAPSDDPNFRNSDEDEIWFEHKDPRTVLPAPTNVTNTVDGANVTISWDEVEGADYYTVYYYLNEDHYVDVTETSYTFEVGYNVGLYVYVLARANEDNPHYLSDTSWNAWTQVITGSENSGEEGGNTGEGGENDINRFEIWPYGVMEIEVHFYLDEGTMNKIVLDFNITEADAKLKTKNYSWDNNGFVNDYSYINGAAPGVFIKTASVDVTNNGDGTYKFVGVVESTAGDVYNINISGTKANS